MPKKQVSQTQESEHEYIFVHHSAVTENILGPGKRLCLWMTGCPYHCKGCIETKLRDIKFGTKFELINYFNALKVFLDSLKAITFSGGEPLFQKDVLFSLLTAIKKRDSSTDIMVYTGMPTKTFLTDYKEFHQLIDLAVTEPFIIEEHDNLLWRGSKNQKIISPSNRYKEAVLKKWMNEKTKGIQMHLNDNDEFFIYGIPAPGVLEKINIIMEKNNIEIQEN